MYFVGCLRVQGTVRVQEGCRKRKQFIDIGKRSLWWWQTHSDWSHAVCAPVAINPRTKKPFAPGDVIYQGEIIGYTGKTGNCYDIPNYHLHLVVVDYETRNAGNGKYLNPEDYINGNVDWTDDNKRTLESLNIINIDCHDENENAKYF